MEGVRGLPQVFEHVDQIDHDGDGDAELARGLLRELELIAVAVDEHAPRALEVRVASPRLLEGVANDGGGGLGDARPHALVAGARATPIALGIALDIAHALQIGEHVDGRVQMRRHRVDRGHLRHALAVVLLALGQPRVQSTRRRLRALAQAQARRASAGAGAAGTRPDRAPARGDVGGAGGDVRGRAGDDSA